MSEALEAFKSGFGFGKEEKKILPKQYPASAPISMHKDFYNKYVKSGFAENFLEEKGMKVAKPYTAGSFAEYLQLRGIGKAYGGKIQPRQAAGSSEKN